MDSVIERIKNEPVLILGLVEAAVALVAAFGLDLSGQQVGAIMAFTAAVIGVIARQQVTPTRTLTRTPPPPPPTDHMSFSADG